MPGNWFQQDYLGKVVKGWHSQGSHFSVFVLIRANSAGIKASSLSKGALSFGNLFLSLAISFQKVIPFALTLHIPPLLLKPVMLYTWGWKQLEMSHFYSPTSLLFRHKTWKKGESLWVNCCHRNLLVMIPLVIIKTMQMGIVSAGKCAHTDSHKHVFPISDVL